MKKIDQKEFDKFADEYESLHQQNIKLSGENPEYFCEYKIKDLLAIARKHQISETGKILDFGCGIGNSINAMGRIFPQAKLYGVDVSPKSIAIAQKQVGRIANIQSYDGTRLPYDDDYFELIFAACVFHHIPQSVYQDVFREIRRVLKPNGKFVIFEHNPLNPLTLHAVNTCPFDENAVLIRSGQLQKMLKQEGIFRKTYHAYRIFFPHFLAKMRPLEQQLKWLPFGAQYYVVAE